MDLSTDEECPSEDIDVKEELGNHASRNVFRTIRTARTRGPPGRYTIREWQKLIPIDGCDSLVHLPSLRGLPRTIPTSSFPQGRDEGKIRYLELYPFLTSISSLSQACSWD